jgi:2-dehydro-3-deoxyphosphogluconate aldolase/(4S)-4-hydroxy-2-oxoglutarate aldolase
VAGAGRIEDLVSSNPQIVRRIEEAGVIAVIRTRDADAVSDLAHALAEAGVLSLEITLTIPGAISLIEQVAARVPSTCLIGAGTVLDAATARAVAGAGARFAASPVFDPSMVEEAQRQGLVVMPGCFTPTEVRAAARQGADFVKLFPASVVGPAFVTALLSTMPDLRLLPTGGVTTLNAVEWLRAGARVVGVGGDLVGKDLGRPGGMERIVERAAHLLQAIRRVRAEAAR